MAPRSSSRLRMLCIATGIAIAVSMVLMLPRQASAEAYTIDRLDGANRYDTMAQAVEVGFPSGSCSTAVVTSGEKFPDALVASSLVGTLDCPLITTNDKVLSSEAKQQLQRLGVTKVYILGGDDTVSPAVEKSIAALDGGRISVKRLEGKTRVETAVKAASEVRLIDASSDTCIVTKSSNFPDALAISAWAANTSSPIFYSENGAFNSQTVSAIKQGGYKKVIVLGDDSGTDGIKDSAVNALGLTSLRLAGIDRYATASAIVKWVTGLDTTKAFSPSASQLLSFDGMALSSGEKFMDALASVNVTGKMGSVLMLGYDNKTTRTVLQEIVGANRDEITSAYVLGAANTVSDEVYFWLDQALDRLKYSYEIYALNPYPIYTNCNTPLFIKTDNPDPEKGFSIECDAIEGWSVGIEFADVPYEGDTQIMNMRKVEGGWLAIVYFDTPGATEIVITEDPKTDWWGQTTGGKVGAVADIEIIDYSTVLNSWIDQKVDKYTDESMNSLEKLQAVANGLWDEFDYPYNDENGYVLLASKYGTYFDTYRWDSYTSPAALCTIAERIGGFEDIHNCYGDYYIGSPEWYNWHYYCRVTFEGEDYYVQACPFSDSGTIDRSEIEMLDFANPSKLILLS